MGKPRMIILIRHAQSEGNKNRDIHQFIPDHRVKLTPHGWTQAEEAGRQLRSLLRPDDTLQFYTSPYRRTRETTEGILRTLTADDPAPSPFPRNKITVFEEPRLREQDFGNFQPCSAEMERMWQERADYGHFFYRIPDGESAADAYDRVSGFNESLWRQFGDDDFPSVCVLVTHGLMSRVFLMKWYHWSVEYFEDLRNVNHCEFIMMKRSDTSSKYILQNELRTWSELRKRTAAAAGTGAPSSSSTPSRSTSTSTSTALGASPTIPTRRWGGCVNGCNHDKANWPKRPMRKNTMEYLNGQLPPPAAGGSLTEEPDQQSDTADAPPADAATPSKLLRKQSTKLAQPPNLPPTPASPNDASADASTSDEGEAASCMPRSHQNPAPRTAAIMRHLQHPGNTPGEGFSDDSDYFPGMQHINTNKSRFRASSRQRQQSKDRKRAQKLAEQGWKEESGMGHGARADTLGDGDGTSDDVPPAKADAEMPTPILPEALKGDMQVEEGPVQEGEEKIGEQKVGEKLDEAEIDRLQEQERKGLGEVY